MRLWLLVLLIVAFGCSGGSVVGKYKVQQDQPILGQGAENGVLELRQDGTFNLTMGTLSLSKGTWKMEGKTISMKESAGAKPVEYRVDADRLIPMSEGQMIETWRFVRQ